MKYEGTLKLVEQQNTEITMGSTYQTTLGSLCYHGEKEKVTKFKYTCKHKKVATILVVNLMIWHSIQRYRGIQGQSINPIRYM
jgi:hypothetical protein